MSERKELKMVKTTAQFFGEHMKALRKKKGLSVIQCAEACGMHPNAYSAYERGVRQPPLDKIFALADFFEITAAELIGETETTSANSFFEYQLRKATRLVTLAGYFADPENDGTVSLTLPGDSKPKNVFIGGKNNSTAIYVELPENTIKIGSRKDFIGFVDNALECAIKENITFDSSVRKLIKEFNDKVKYSTLSAFQKKLSQDSQKELLGDPK